MGDDSWTTVFWTRQGSYTFTAVETDLCKLKPDKITTWRGEVGMKSHS